MKELGREIQAKINLVPTKKMEEQARERVGRVLGTFNRVEFGEKISRYRRLTDSK